MTQPKKKKEKEAHVFMGNNSVRCHNCGEEQKFAPAEGGGFDINVMLGTMKGFDKTHKKCKPSARGKARFEYKTPDEWFKSWDTGTSSVTLYAIISGKAVNSSSRPEPPMDPSDFGRCYRLLQLVEPAVRKDTMKKVAERHLSWKRMAAAWNELTKLWETETKNPNGLAPELYKRLQELR